MYLSRIYVTVIYLLSVTKVTITNTLHDVFEVVVAYFTVTQAVPTSDNSEKKKNYK